MKIQFFIVRFGGDSRFQNNLDTIKRYFPEAEFTVLNNMPNSGKSDEIPGSNSAFEFSGYLELLESSTWKGKVILVNDTLFKHHFTQGWLALLKRFCSEIKDEENVIYGDIRWDGTDLMERPNPFLASWLFVIPGAKSQEIFANTLKRLINNPIPELSAKYELFLTEWLESDKLWRGWQGSGKDSGYTERKRKCIYWEHQLSASLAKDGIPLKSIGDSSRFEYSILRVLDRMKISIWRIAYRLKGLLV